MIRARHLRRLVHWGVVACAIAATSTSTGHGASSDVNVPVVVPVVITSFDTSGCGIFNPAATGFGMMLRGSTMVTGTDCVITLDSNSQYGAQIRASDQSDTWGMQTVALEVPGIVDLPSGGSTLAYDPGFGMCLRTMSGGAVATMNVSVCGPWDSGWHPLKLTDDLVVATQSSPGPMTVGLRFGVHSQASTPPGEYVANIDFEAILP